MYTRRNLLGVALGALTVSATRAFSRDLPHDLLFIHGRGQGGFNPAVLESRWMHAFKLGAQKLGRTIPSTLNVSFPFYGDALDQFAKASKVPSTAGIRPEASHRTTSSSYFRQSSQRTSAPRQA